MFRFVTIVAPFFLVLPGVALAQQPAAPLLGWDVAASAGSFHGHPGVDTASVYGDDWYHDSELRLTVGRYWTTHLKTELEFGATGEGDRFVQRFAAQPGSTTPYPYSAQDFFRVRQGSAKVAWQFLDNQWIHPYLFAGVSIDAERKRTHVRPQTYYTGDSRLPNSRMVVIPQEHEAPRTTIRPGLVLGGGAKWYVSPRVFVKTGAQVSFARPASAISFLAGMGFDF